MEREVYTREFHDGCYRAGSYVASKLLTDVPSSGLGALGWSAIVYWGVGLRASPGAFFFFGARPRTFPTLPPYLPLLCSGDRSAPARPPFFASAAIIDTCPEL